MRTKERSSSVQYLLDYFGVHNPREVSWAHRVNKRKELEDAIQNPSTMMIEGDIYCIQDSCDLIMTHPELGRGDILHDTWPTRQSRLTISDTLYLDEWLECIVDSKKGAKLDFKNKEAVLPTLKYIKGLNDLQNTPLIFNADVLRGPGGRRPEFDAEEFADAVNTFFPDSIVSLGFTTSYRKGAVYDHSLIKQMLSLTHKFDGQVTFAVRACYVEDSIKALLTLLENNDHMICIFNNEVLSQESLARIEQLLSAKRTFIDFWEHPDLPNYRE